LTAELTNSATIDCARFARAFCTVVVPRTIPGYRTIDRALDRRHRIVPGPLVFLCQSGIECLYSVDVLLVGESFLVKLLLLISVKSERSVGMTLSLTDPARLAAFCCSSPIDDPTCVVAALMCNCACCAATPMFAN